MTGCLLTYCGLIPILNKDYFIPKIKHIILLPQALFISARRATLSLLILNITLSFKLAFSKIVFLCCSSKKCPAAVTRNAAIMYSSFWHFSITHQTVTWFHVHLLFLPHFQRLFMFFKWKYYCVQVYCRLSFASDDTTLTPAYCITPPEKYYTCAIYNTLSSTDLPRADSRTWVSWLSYISSTITELDGTVSGLY